MAMRASGTSSRSVAATMSSMSAHAVVHEEHLTLAQQLAADRLGHRRSSYSPT
jgi:hypothetical protein